MSKNFERPLNSIDAYSIRYYDITPEVQRSLLLLKLFFPSD